MIARASLLAFLVGCSANRLDTHGVDATTHTVSDAGPGILDGARDASRDPHEPERVDASVACVPNGPFAEAQRVGTSVRFRVDDSVDPHSTTGGDLRAKSGASVRVSDLRCESGSTVVVLEWTADDGSSIPAQLPYEWRVSGGRIVEFTGESTFGESEIAQAKTPVCHVTKDKGPYGATVRRICIDKKGLFSLREENLSGPRRISLTRQ